MIIAFDHHTAEETGKRARIGKINRLRILFLQFGRFSSDRPGQNAAVGFAYLIQGILLPEIDLIAMRNDWIIPSPPLRVRPGYGSSVPPALRQSDHA